MDLALELSPEDRILSINQGWTDFSVPDGGAPVTAPSVIGFPLWKFVAGGETRSYLNSMFFCVRTHGISLSVLYRCDSDTARRVFQMDVRPRPKGHLLLVHRLQAEMAQHRKLTSFPVRRPIAQCSQCLSVHVNGSWLPVALLPRRGTAQVSDRVCPDCRHSLARQIDAALAAREPHVAKGRP